MDYSRREVLRALASAWGLLYLPAASRPALRRSMSVDAALKAERWISRSMRRTATGAAWPADPLKPDVIDWSLYNGMPGVVLFLAELHAVTGEQRFLTEAKAGAASIAAEIERMENPGLYTGLAGFAFVLAQVPGHETDAKRAVGRLLQQPPLAVNDIVGGAAGVGLTLLWFGETAAATKHGERLIEAGKSANGGLKWAPASTGSTLYPNFSHGTAGVAYFLATLSEKTRDKRFLDAALAGVRYLDSVAVRNESSYKVFHREPGGTDLFYLSWCHGPVGPARLFYRLNRVTGEKQWLDRVHECARAIMDSGVPEQRTPGYWNNISQCCGDAGVGEFFIALNGIEPRPEYRQMVDRVESRLLREATSEGDGLKWVQAEHRVRPELLIAQTGLMQGASGVGLFLLHADAMRQGRPGGIKLPDNPFV